MRARNHCVALALLSSVFVVSAVAQWTQQCDTIATITDNGNGVLVAKEQNLFFGHGWDGVFRSTDNGVTWTAVNYGLTLTDRVSCLAVVPASDGDGSTNLFAGTLAATIYRSTNDGESWTKVYDGPNNGFSTAITAFGVSGSTILAGLYMNPVGVLCSKNDGGSWSSSNTGLPTDTLYTVYDTYTPYCFASAVVGSTTYFYAGTRKGVYVSTTDGTSWTSISNGLPYMVVQQLAAIQPSGTALVPTLFAGVWENGMYRSTDNGVSWTAADKAHSRLGTTTTLAQYVDGIAAGPSPDGTVPSVFAVVSQSVYVSTDKGDNWWDTDMWSVNSGGASGALCLNGNNLFAATYYYSCLRLAVGADTGWVVQTSGRTDSLCCVKAVDNQVAWTGGKNGTVLRTTTAGNSWSSVGGGTIGSATVIAIEARDADTAFVSTYADGAGRILRTTDGGSSWSSVFSESAVAFGGIQMKDALNGFAVGTPAGGNWTVLRTTNGGAGWDGLKTAPQADSLMTIAAEYYEPSSLQPVGVQLLGDTLWFGSLSGVVYRSTDLGATWTTSANNGDTFVLRGLHFNSSSTGIAGGMLGSSEGSTEATADGGNSWATAGTVGSQTISCMSGLGNEFWATAQGGIAYTHDAGQTWTFSAPGYWWIFSTLDAVSFAGSGSSVSGWAVGDSGRILYYNRTGTSGVVTNRGISPVNFALQQNYPNPFNPTTVISGQWSADSWVSLVVFDLLGREVATLANGRYPVGRYSFTFDAKDLASGMYFYRLQAGSFVQTRKMLLVR